MKSSKVHRVSLTYAKAHLSELLSEAESGNDVVITRHGQDIARLSKVAQPAPKEPIPLAELAEFRAKMPKLRMPSSKLIREMRDEGY